VAPVGIAHRRRGEFGIRVVETADIDPIEIAAERIEMAAPERVDAAAPPPVPRWRMLDD
jgi:hypothetical protein